MLLNCIWNSFTDNNLELYTVIQVNANGRTFFNQAQQANEYIFETFYILPHEFFSIVTVSFQHSNLAPVAQPSLSKKEIVTTAAIVIFEVFWQNYCVGHGMAVHPSLSMSI